MSRGLGWLERAILDRVPAAPRTAPVSEIGRQLFGEAPAESQLRSLRRSAASLARKGLVTAELRRQPVWVHDVVGGARPGGAGYWKRDRGYRPGWARMNTLSRPAGSC